MLRGRITKLADRGHLRVFGHAPSPEMRTFAGQLSWSGLGGILGGLVLFLLAILGGRLLGPVEYGRGVFVTAVALTVMVLFSAGLDLASTRALARSRDDHERREIVSTSLAFVVTSVLVLGLLLFLVRGSLGHLFDADQQVVIAAIGLGGVLSLKTLLERHLAGLQLFRYQAVVKLVEAAVSISVFLGLVFLLDLRDFRAMVIAVAAGGLALTALYAARIWSYISARAFNKSVLIQLFRYGRLVIVGYAVGVLLAQSDKFSINRFLGAYELGQYAAYYAGSMAVLLQTLTILSNVLFPAMSRLQDKRPIVRKIDRLAAILSLPIALSILLGLFAVLALFGERFPLHLPLAMLFAAWGTLFSVNAVYAVLVNAHSRRTLRRELLFQPVRLAALIAYIAVCLALDAFSLEAMAIGMILVEILETANLRWIIVRHVLPTPSTQSPDEVPRLP